MANLNTAITPAPVITAQTKGRATASGYTGNVTMALDNNPSNATLGGTTVVAASGGVATFSNLTLNRSGVGFTLRATGAEQGGVTPRAVTSRPFSIPTQLVFTTQPTGVAAPDDILPAFVVTVRDGAGNTDTEYEGDITVSLYAGAATGILTGLFTRAAENGVATFTGLSIDEIGTYSFLAEGAESLVAAKPSPKVSNTFRVGAYDLIVIASIADLNIYNAVAALYGTPAADSTVNVTVNPGVVISASATSGAAMTWGNSWAGTPVLSLVNNGYIVGKGGSGGNGSGQSPSIPVPGTAGAAGGKAMELSGETVTITNASGFIWGGGGGGGGGAAVRNDGGSNQGNCGGGGGGSGAGDGTGGSGGESFVNVGPGEWVIDSESVAGANESGSLITQNGTVGGLGATAHNDDPVTVNAPPGGDGGDYGSAGTSGSNVGGGTAGFIIIEPATAGGAAGKAINLTGGTANFVNGSGSPNVKGAVS